MAEPTGTPGAALECREITKYYGRSLALHRVNLQLRPGELLGLVGDNGAGKSTLVKILRGVIRPTSGEIYVNGERKVFGSPREAQQAGIQSVYQEDVVVDQLSVAENFFLGQEPVAARVGPLRLVDYRKMAEEARRYLARMGFELNVYEEISGFSGGEKQAVEILRALYFDPKILLLDEPTTALSERAKQKLFELLQETKKLCPMILITHELFDAVRLCDRILVIRHGEIVHELARMDMSEEKAFKEIVSRF